MKTIRLARVAAIAWIAIAALFLAACQQEETPPVAEGAAATVEAPVSRAAEAGVVSAEGQVVPRRAVDLAFLTGGTVAEVVAQEGQQVAAGDPLIRLDAAAVESGLTQAQAGLEAANANLRAAEAQLALTEAQRQSAEAVVAVAEAQLALVQAGPRPEQIAAAERGVAAAEAGVAQAAGQRDAALSISDSRVRAAEAQLAAADAQLASLEEAYDTIITTCFDTPDGGEVCPLLGAPEENARAQLEAAKASREAALLAVRQAQEGPTAAQQQSANAGVALAVAQRDLAQAQLDLVRAGAREEQIRQAEIGVEQARLGVTQVDVAAKQAEAAVAQARAGVQSAQAAVDSAQTALDRMTLTAPFAGIVGDVGVEVGELVAPGIPVTSLADAADWFVETTDLVELDVVFLEVGQAAEVVLDALPGETLAGVVTEISQVPELTRGDVTYRVRIDLEDYPDLPIRQGMTALVTIETE
jgi:HlyD family secretion protein